MTVNRGFAVLYAAVALILLVKLLRPYPLPEAREILPPSAPGLETAEDTDLLARMRERNIFQSEEEAAAAAAEEDAEAAAEKESKAAEKAEQVIVWRLEAVSVAGSESHAVVTSTLGTNSYQVGDALPDGAKLLEIGSTGVLVERSGKQESVYLFGKK